MNNPNTNTNNSNPNSGFFAKAKEGITQGVNNVTQGFNKLTNWAGNILKPKTSSSQVGQTQPPATGGRRKRTKKYRKGSRSKTRKGRKDFITHKGSKYYNRRGHRQTRNSKGRKKRPYKSRSRKGGSFVV